MIAAAALLAYAALAATTGARLLASAHWPLRAPAWGIWAWQALSISAATALVLAAAVVALPATALGPAVATALRACSLALAEHYAAPGGPPVAIVVGLAGAGVLARFGALVLGDLRRSAVRRRAQRDTLALVGTRCAGGFTLVEHAAPLVYCLPGRTDTVVVTSAARDLLTARQLDLVLAHERRHLRARHHTAMTLSHALSRTFGGYGVFGLAHQHLAVLAEMQADDAVGAARDRRALAHALLALAPSGGAAGRRVRRLAEPTEGPGRRLGPIALVAGLGVLTAPVALALVPAVEASVRDCCPAAYSRLPAAPGQAPARVGGAGAHR